MTPEPFDRRRSAPGRDAIAAPDPAAAADLDLDLDRTLDLHFNAPAEQLTPSSGFVLSVLETVHQHAAEPPPLAFPWRRFLPGTLASLCILAVFLIFVWNRLGTGLTNEAHLIVVSPSLAHAVPAVFWSVAALCLSMAALAAAFRLTGDDS